VEVSHDDGRLRGLERRRALADLGLSDRVGKDDAVVAEVESAPLRVRALEGTVGKPVAAATIPCERSESTSVRVRRIRMELSLILSFTTSSCEQLFGDYVFRLRPFLSLRHFHRDLLSFLKGFEAFHLYCCVMYEYILTTIALDEAKSLVIIEPLDGS